MSKGIGDKISDFVTKGILYLVHPFALFFTWRGQLKKIIEWSKKNNYKITAIEGCNRSETDFPSPPTSDYCCVKIVLIDHKSDYIGAYLLVYVVLDAGFIKHYLVPAQQIKFSSPYKIVNGKLVNYSADEEGKEK
jgi:hypothetical protein